MAGRGGMEVQAVCRGLFASCLSQQCPVFAVGWAVPSPLRYLSSFSAEESGRSPNLGMEAAIRAMAHPGAAVGLHEHPKGLAAS